MTASAWVAIAASVAMLLLVVIIVAMDTRRDRQQAQARKSIPRDLPEEGRWR